MDKSVLYPSETCLAPIHQLPERWKASLIWAGDPNHEPGFGVKPIDGGSSDCTTMRRSSAFVRENLLIMEEIHETFSLVLHLRSSRPLESEMNTWLGCALNPDSNLDTRTVGAFYRLRYKRITSSVGEDER